MTIVKFAFDRSMRSVDTDGRLHIEKSHISKATVNPYYGKEIPGYKELGLDPDKIYKLLRDPAELEKGAPTFARLPILKEHVPLTVDAPKPELVIGAIGSNVTFENPYLDADTCFWDAGSIAGIDSGKIKELSCAYRYVPIMEAGNFNGEDYDGRMTEIKGNHLALVEAGRAGSDVVVADSNPFSFKEKTMHMTKLGKAMFAALCAASPILAADAALPALIGPATKKNFKKTEIKEKLMALDASLDSNKLDAVLDAILDTEQEPKAVETPKPPAKDESPADKVKAMLAGKVDDAMIEEICKMMSTPAKDEKNAEGNDDEDEPTSNEKPVAATDKDVKAATDKDVKAAMDSLRKDLRDAQEACREVRSVVGDVIGMDSAADVYKFALDHMKIERDDVDSVAALRALYKVASSKSPQMPTFAQIRAASIRSFRTPRASVTPKTFKERELIWAIHQRLSKSG